MEAGILLENRDVTDAADSGDEIAGGVLERPVGHGEVRDEDGSAGSLLHRRKAIGDPDSSIKAAPGGTHLAAYSPVPLRQDLPQGTGDVLILGMATGLFFRVDETVVEHDLEPPAAGRDQDEAIDDALEFIEQLIGRAHGTVPIASNGAVFDAEIHAGHASRYRNGTVTEDGSPA